MQIQWNLADSVFTIIRTTIFIAHYNLDDHIAANSDSELPRVALVQMTADTCRPHAKHQDHFKRDFKIKTEDVNKTRKMKEEITKS
jgi:hypothetical protein